MKAIKVLLTLLTITLLIAIWYVLRSFDGLATLMFALVASYFLFYGLRSKDVAAARANQDSRPSKTKLNRLQLTQDPRVSCVVWLAGAAAIMGIGWWYPFVLARQISGTDDRMGFAMIAAIPFDLLAVIVAISSGLRLRKLIVQQKTPGNALLGAVGAVCALFTLVPGIYLLVCILHMAVSIATFR